MPYYYHVSNRNFGEDFVMHPRDDGDNRAINEPKVSRICVGPTPWHCAIALGDCLMHGDEVCVYRTKVKIDNAARPYGVQDKGMTAERWLINSTQFIKINSIPSNVLSICFVTGATDNINTQKKYLPILRKQFQQYGFTKRNMEAC